MSVSGSLATMLLGDLLQWCGNNLMTGTITLRRGPIEKKLFFKKGRLFSSTSSSPRETLGQYLIRSGYLTEEELFKALIEQDRTDRRLGQILLSTKAITEEVLEELLRLKTEEAIYDCFLWEDGEFIFEDDVLPDSIPVFLPLEVTGVILEGARRSDEWRRIHEVFPSRLSTFDVDRAAVAKATDLSEEDQRVIELIERGKNLAEISLELHAVEFYAASRLLELHARKLVTVKDSPDETDFDTQVKELREKLDTGASLYHAEGAREVPSRSRDRSAEQTCHFVQDQDRSRPRGLGQVLRDLYRRRAAPQSNAERALQARPRPARRLRPFARQRRMGRGFHHEDLPDDRARCFGNLQQASRQRAHRSRLTSNELILQRVMMPRRTTSELK